MFKKEAFAVRCFRRASISLCDIRRGKAEGLDVIIIDTDSRFDVS